MIRLILVFFVFLGSCSFSKVDFSSENCFEIYKDLAELASVDSVDDKNTEIKSYIYNIVNRNNLGSINNMDIFEQKVILKKQIEKNNMIISIFPDFSRRILVGTNYIPTRTNNSNYGSLSTLLTLIQDISKVRPKEFGIDIILFDSYKKEELDDFVQQLLHYYDNNIPEYAVILGPITSEKPIINIDKKSYDNAPQLIKILWNIAESNNWKAFNNSISDHKQGLHSALLERGIKSAYLTVENPQENLSKKDFTRCSNIFGSLLIKLIYQDYEETD